MGVKRLNEGGSEEGGSAKVGRGVVRLNYLRKELVCPKDRRQQMERWQMER